jgi:hypothetical protein
MGRSVLILIAVILGIFQSSVAVATLNTEAIYSCELRLGVWERSDWFDSRDKSEEWCGRFYSIFNTREGCKIERDGDKYRWRSVFSLVGNFRVSGYSYSEVRFQLSRNFFEWSERYQLYRHPGVKVYTYYPERCG